jgi:exosortase
MLTLRKQALRIVPALILLAVSYHPVMIWLYKRWTFPGSYYGHGFLIPLLSCYLIYRNRKEFADLTPASSLWGLPFLFSGLAIHLLSLILRVRFTSGFSLLLTLVGLSLLFFGREISRAVLFPLLFLGFMIPLPMNLIARLNLELKFLALHGALAILKFFQVAVVREGSILHFLNGSIAIEEVCSGLRTLIALIAFSVFFTCLIRDSRAKKALLLVASVPVAILANIVRVLLLCYMVTRWGVHLLDTWLHELTGILVFVVAFGLLVLVRALPVFPLTPPAPTPGTSQHEQ